MNESSILFSFYFLASKVCCPFSRSTISVCFAFSGLLKFTRNFYLAIECCQQRHYFIARFKCFMNAQLCIIKYISQIFYLSFSLSSQQVTPRLLFFLDEEKSLFMLSNELHCCEDVHFLVKLFIIILFISLYLSLYFIEIFLDEKEEKFFWLVEIFLLRRVNRAN